MNGHGEKLSLKAEALIVALMANPTIAAAAASVGIAEKTARTWLRRDDFTEAYRAARREVSEVSLGLLQAQTCEAATTLGKNLTCKSPSARNRAADLILTHAARGVELTDLAERVATLERDNASRRTPRVAG
jgi:hypothetical protein